MVYYDEMWYKLKEELIDLSNYYLEWTSDKNLNKAHDGDMMAQAVDMALYYMDLAEEDAGLTPKRYN